MPVHAAVLLAAGLSRRMGHPKALAPLGGQALCRHAALAALADRRPPDTLLAVVPAGPTGEQIAAVLTDLPITCVPHEQAERGLLSSFQRAVTALPAGIEAVTFALADMPYVTARTHRALRAAFQATGAPLVVTRYGPPARQVTAPPLLVRADLLPHLLRLPSGDTGPRALLQAYAAQTVFITRPAPELTDIDTPGALAWAQAHPPR